MYVYIIYICIYAHRRQHRSGAAYARAAVAKLLARVKIHKTSLYKTSHSLYIHVYICIYIYIYVYVCMCICVYRGACRHRHRSGAFYSDSAVSKQLARVCISETYPYKSSLYISLYLYMYMYIRICVFAAINTALALPTPDAAVAKLLGRVRL